MEEIHIHLTVAQANFLRQAVEASIATSKKSALLGVTEFIVATAVITTASEILRLIENPCDCL